ncbi:hypothetical protein [Polaromonas hydrogenivorans]|uniref:Uncharacterized protein n=1 Tax=Polaromonas hydrogenivorans TaxID=335476 RepID=A0AAU7LZN3_9BURK
MKSLAISSIAALAFAASSSFAAGAPAWQPCGMVVQGGLWTHVDSAAVDLAWDWRWRRDYSIGTLTGYTKMDIGRWRTRGRIDDKGLYQSHVMG